MSEIEEESNILSQNGSTILNQQDDKIVVIDCLETIRRDNEFISSKSNELQTQFPDNKNQNNLASFDKSINSQVRYVDDSPEQDIHEDKISNKQILLECGNKQSTKQNLHKIYKNISSHHDFSQGNSKTQQTLPIKQKGFQKQQVNPLNHQTSLNNNHQKSQQSTNHLISIHSNNIQQSHKNHNNPQHAQQQVQQTPVLYGKFKENYKNYVKIQGNRAHSIGSQINLNKINHTNDNTSSSINQQQKLITDSSKKNGIDNFTHQINLIQSISKCAKNKNKSKEMIIEDQSDNSAINRKTTINSSDSKFNSKYSYKVSKTLNQSLNSRQSTNNQAQNNKQQVKEGQKKSQNNQQATTVTNQQQNKIEILKQIYSQRTLDQQQQQQKQPKKQNIRDNKGTTDKKTKYRDQNELKKKFNDRKPSIIISEIKTDLTTIQNVSNISNINTAQSSVKMTSRRSNESVRQSRDNLKPFLHNKKHIISSKIQAISDAIDSLNNKQTAGNNDISTNQGSDNSKEIKLRNKNLNDYSSSENKGNQETSTNSSKYHSVIKQGFSYQTLINNSQSQDVLAEKRFSISSSATPFKNSQQDTLSPFNGIQSQRELDSNIKNDLNGFNQIQDQNDYNLREESQSMKKNQLFMGEQSKNKLPFYNNYTTGNNTPIGFTKINFMQIVGESQNHTPNKIDKSDNEQSLSNSSKGDSFEREGCSKDDFNNFYGEKNNNALLNVIKEDEQSQSIIHSDNLENREQQEQLNKHLFFDGETFSTNDNEHSNYNYKRQFSSFVTLLNKQQSSQNEERKDSQNLCCLDQLLRQSFASSSQNAGNEKTINAFNHIIDGDELEKEGFMKEQSDSNKNIKEDDKQDRLSNLSQSKKVCVSRLNPKQATSKFSYYYQNSQNHNTSLKSTISSQLQSQQDPKDKSNEEHLRKSNANSKNVPSALPLSETANQMRRLVEKQYQTLQKYERDSKSRKHTKGSNTNYNSTHQKTQNIVSQNIKNISNLQKSYQINVIPCQQESNKKLKEEKSSKNLKESITNLINFNLSRQQNFRNISSHHMTTSKKNRKQFESAIQSEKKIVKRDMERQATALELKPTSSMKDEVMKCLTSQEHTMSVENLTQTHNGKWPYNEYQEDNHNDLTKSNTQGRNLMSEFKTLEKQKFLTYDAQSPMKSVYSKQNTAQNSRNYRPPSQCFLKKNSAKFDTQELTSQRKILSNCKSNPKIDLSVNSKKKESIGVIDSYYDQGENKAKQRQNLKEEKSENKSFKSTPFTKASYLSPGNSNQKGSQNNQRNSHITNDNGSMQISIIDQSASNKHNAHDLSSSKILRSSNQTFHAKEYKEKTGFMVLRSTKILTVPQDFNFNTDRRAQERSLSKNERNQSVESRGLSSSNNLHSNLRNSVSKLQSADRSGKKVNFNNITNINNNFENKPTLFQLHDLMSFGPERRYQNFVIEEEENIRQSGQDLELSKSQLNASLKGDQKQETSLLDRLIKEYDLEDVFKNSRFKDDSIDSRCSRKLNYQEDLLEFRENTFSRKYSEQMKISDCFMPQQ